MLKSLHIQHFAIVRNLELDFEAGMTVLTGETGAGKSIMIDALLLALGGRTDLKVVRPGAAHCDIQAVFDKPKSPAFAQWLEEQGLLNDSDDIFLRRIISAEGRSKAYINGVSLGLTSIKACAEFLIEIHGQHEHQRLLNPAIHRQHLDVFAQHETLCRQVHDAYHAYQALEAEKAALSQFNASAEQSLMLQIEELEELNPHLAEAQTLHDEQQVLGHAERYLQNIQSIQSWVDADEGPNLRQLFHQISQALAGLPQNMPNLQSARELFDNARVLTEEALADLNQFAKVLRSDPQRLSEVESRMSALHHFARKYRVDVHHLAEHAQALQQKQKAYEDAQARRANLDERRAHALATYQKAAEALRRSREQQAPLLAEAITQHLRALAMPHGYVKIAITPTDNPQPHGLDKVEYLVSANPGLSPQALSKIASGGELSRISLAIQLISAEQSGTPTLIFDEVDVGIGGATAAILGQQLQQLAKHTQVCCVTHQAQVAASAKHHFLVEKYTEQDQTFCRITPLNQEARREEIARMIGGLSITAQTRAHAEELLGSLA